MDSREPGSDGQQNAGSRDGGVELRLSVVFPTYGRESVLVDSIRAVLALDEPPSEVLVVDQTPKHEPETELALESWVATGLVRWIRLQQPSITHAMNVGLMEARGDVVLFLDDDIIPHEKLVASHRKAHGNLARPADERMLIAGRVLQPWHVDGSRPLDRMASEKPGFVEEFMGGNFSVNRVAAVQLGGFDEQFVRVAYRFEAEFASRARRAGWRIPFLPDATIHHLRAERGGTRSFGEHLRTVKPSHAVGQYYFLLRVKPPAWMRALLVGPFRAVVNRYHMKNPWWIPVVFIAHVWGALWAAALYSRGARLLMDVATTGSASRSDSGTSP